MADFGEVRIVFPYGEDDPDKHDPVHPNRKYLRQVERVAVCRVRPVGMWRRFPLFRGLPFVSGHAITLSLEVTGVNAEVLQVRGRYHQDDQFRRYLECSSRASIPGGWRATITTPSLGPGYYRIDPEIALGGIVIPQEMPSFFRADVQSSDGWSLQLLTMFFALGTILVAGGGAWWGGKMQSDATDRQIVAMREIAATQSPVAITLVLPTPLPTVVPTADTVGSPTQ